MAKRKKAPGRVDYRNEDMLPPVFDQFPNVFKAVEEGCDFITDKMPEPTTSRPGSFARVDAMARRVENGEVLWHPDDPKDCSGIQPGEELPRRNTGLESAFGGRRGPRQVYQMPFIEDEDYE